MKNQTYTIKLLKKEIGIFCLLLELEKEIFSDGFFCFLFHKIKESQIYMKYFD